VDAGQATAAVNVSHSSSPTVMMGVGVERLTPWRSG